MHPVPRRVAFGLVRRSAVLDARDAIDILVKRLRSPEPVAPEGMALIERMLSDGAWSPLYNAGPSGALRRLAVLATAAAFAIQSWAQSILPPSHTALLITLEPVFAWITSFLVLGERLTRRPAAGAVLILAGIALTELVPQPHPATAHEG